MSALWFLVIPAAFAVAGLLNIDWGKRGGL